LADLSSKPLIIAKGLMFLGIAACSSYLLLADLPTARCAVLLALIAWSSARFYYFLFYVLERYVDPSLRYAGIIALLQAILSRRKAWRE
jgi:hypothetical protein